ncbi:MAG: hypothetical protein ABJD97_09195 [Betaproteobacteria bacterium]
MKPSPFLAPSSLQRACLAVLLGLAATCAHADQDVFGAEVEPAPLGSEVVDPIVFATLLPNPDVVRPALMQAAIAAAMAAPERKPKSIVPITAVAIADRAPRPVRFDPNAMGSTNSRLLLDSNQVVQIQANGLPAANSPDPSPFVRVMPRSVNPADVTFGARWGAADRIQAPLLSQLAWDAHAEVVSGAPPPRAGNVRRSLRITAMWDTPEDMSVGFTPGFQRGGGMAFEHYVAGLQVSTVDKTKAARWHSWVELSGEKLAFNNVIENNTAQVQAAATSSASSSTQLDFSVSRGTTPTATNLQSNVGLSVHF